MKALSKRLDALEAKPTPASQRWVRIYRDEEQPEDEAIAAYEAEHGKIGDANIIMHVSVKPVPRATA